MQSQKRWGIIVLAVGMFFVTAVAMQIFGNLLSMFGAAWIMIGWYAYKGDLQSASSWSKWAIFVGIGVVVLSYFFIGDNNNPITMRVKNQSSVGVGVMAVPLILLYFYLVNQVTKIVNNTETGGEKIINPKNKHNSSPNIYTTSAAPHHNKPAAVKASIDASSSAIRPLIEGMPKRTTDFNMVGALAGEDSSNTLPTIITLAGQAMNTELLTEEDHWATAMLEVDSGQCRPGVWAKAFAESEGDETKAKVAYLKSRVQQLTDAAKLIQAQQEATRQRAAEKSQAEALEKKRAVEAAIALFVKNKELSNEQLTLIVQFADMPRLITLCNPITGNTLLHACAERDMLVEVDALLKAGADSQRSNNNGKRPKFMARSWAIRLVLTGTDISVGQLKRAAEVGVEQDGDEFTFANHKFQVLQEAVDYAIAVSQMPQPELRRAVLGGNWSTAKNLLESGVSPLGKDVDGRTLLDHARGKRDKLLIDLLESHGAE
jgi:hypothetical protein